MLLGDQASKGGRRRETHRPRHLSISGRPHQHLETGFLVWVLYFCLLVIILCSCLRFMIRKQKGEGCWPCLTKVNWLTQQVAFSGSSIKRFSGVTSTRSSVQAQSGWQLWLLSFSCHSPLLLSASRLLHVEEVVLYLKPLLPNLEIEEKFVITETDVQFEEICEHKTRWKSLLALT